MRRTTLLAIVVGLLMLPAASVVGAEEGWFGVWKVNIAKSTYRSGAPAFKRMTCTIEPWEDRLRVTYEITGLRGGITHIEWIGRFDGRPYPVAGIDGYVVTHAYRRVDDRTLDVIQRTEGSPPLVARMTLAPDGRTLTTITPWTEAAARDRRLTATTVYDRE